MRGCFTAQAKRLQSSPFGPDKSNGRYGKTNVHVFLDKYKDVRFKIYIQNISLIFLLAIQ